MHLKNTSNTFFLVLSSIKYIRTGIHCTGVYTEICQFTNKWVCHNLECKCCKRFFIRRMSHYRVAIQVSSLDWRNICWSRHILKDCIQKFLNTFVSVSGTAANRYCCTLTGSFSEDSFHSVYRRLFSLKVLHHEVIIQLADLLDQLCMIKLSIFLHVFRNINDGDVITFFIVVDVSFHFE